MKLFLLKQDEASGWDTFDSMVIAAESREAAIQVHPYGYPIDDDEGFCSDSWARNPENIAVTYLGETELPAGVICASFNAG